MPKLPTVQKLGRRPVPRSQRGVASVRAGIAESAEAQAARLVGGAEASAFREAGAAAGEVADISFAFREEFAKEDAEIEALALDTEYSNAIRVLQLGDGSDQKPGYLNLRGEAARRMDSGGPPPHFPGRGQSPPVSDRGGRRSSSAAASTSLSDAPPAISTFPPPRRVAV